VGDTSVTDIPKRAAMAASSVLYKHFNTNPEALEYRFSRGYIHPGAVRFLLISWMRETCNEFEAYAIPAQKTFAEDIAILRAARLLGMERYCRHILIGYVDYLKTQLPSYEEIITVEQNATSDKDPLWTAMVNHLCHDRFKGLIPDAEDFEAFLEKHTRLKKAMESADNFFAGYAKKQAEGRERERYQRWEQNQAEKRQRIAKERLAAELLKKKLDEKGSGLMTVTADEAELLRGRTRTR
jgi:DNA-directed RNA polymerase subunit N (RpoN/RPB10)